MNVLNIFKLFSINKSTFLVILKIFHDFINFFTGYFFTALIFFLGLYNSLTTNLKMLISRLQVQIPPGPFTNFDKKNISYLQTIKIS